jgi:hypothetical protein
MLFGMLLIVTRNISAKGDVGNDAPHLSTRADTYKAHLRGYGDILLRLLLKPPDLSTRHRGALQQRVALKLETSCDPGHSNSLKVHTRHTS